MNQTRRTLDYDLIVEGVVSRLTTMGLKVLDRGTLPCPPQHTWEVEKPIAHDCFGQWEEYFPYGVPVLKEVLVSTESGALWKATLRGPTYWTDDILVLHEGTVPDLREWRLLHFLEAAPLLAMARGLGAIRYASPNGSGGVTELYLVRNTGKAYVQCGNSPREHHAAYTRTRRISIDEVRY